LALYLTATQTHALGEKNIGVFFFEHTYRDDRSRIVAGQEAGQGPRLEQGQPEQRGPPWGRLMAGQRGTVPRPVGRRQDAAGSGEDARACRKAGGGAAMAELRPARRLGAVVARAADRELAGEPGTSEAELLVFCKPD